MPPARVVSRWVGGLFASVLVAALSLVPGLQLWRFATSSQALPQWDMAAHGVQGLRLADAVRQLDPLGWLLEIHGMSTWPPTWPLVESAAFLVFGGEVSVARGLVVICWMLSVVAAFWALRAITPGPRGDAVGLLAAAWLAQAPLLQALSTVNLLEVPGTLGLMVCLGCALRALDPEASSERRARWWRDTWLSALAALLPQIQLRPAVVDAAAAVGAGATPGRLESSGGVGLAAVPVGALDAVDDLRRRLSRAAGGHPTERRHRHGDFRAEAAGDVDRQSGVRAAVSSCACVRLWEDALRGIDCVDAGVVSTRRGTVWRVC